jgi:glutamate racemase
LPYGTKSAETVARYAIGATRLLESQNIDLLVIACNTATALALPRIQQAAHVPVVGVVEPGAAMAAEMSQTRSAIVIATEATVSSHAYRDALQRHGLATFEKACPLFVPLVEEGWIEHPVTEQVARIYLAEAMAGANDDADVLVLACTHYPLIAPLLRRITPPQLKTVDSAESTARVVKKMVEQFSAHCHPERSRGTPFATTIPALEHRTFCFYVTDSVDNFKRLAGRFLGRQVDHVEHVDLEG